jgi:hypothetical protein
VKRPGLQRKNHLLSGQAHTSVLAMGKLKNLHYELLGHPPYFPDLAPSDFCLFSKLKIFLAGQRFSSNQEAIAAVERYFADLTKNHYRDGIMALEHRWNKCISVKGNCVENKTNFEIIIRLLLLLLLLLLGRELYRPPS